jgi:GT2 family glycosyltransferase
LICIVVATRDRPEHLHLCLAALAAQEGGGEMEVAVADDGSGPSTLEVLDAWRRKAPFPIVHAWEENRGFRLARARNRGIRASRAPYLIFLDGDCVPPPRYLAAHRAARRGRTYLAGDRLLLDRTATGILLAAPGLGPEAALAAATRLERIRAARRAALDRIYRLLHLKDRPKPLGANLSAWRGDLERANGFDERFEGWGFEDEDLGRRLSQLGIRKTFAPSAARVVHLWHPPDPTFRGRAASSPNAARLRRGFFLARCRAGLEQRPLADLRARILGFPALEPAFPVRAAAGERAELEVVGPRGGSFDPRSEVRIAACPRGSTRPRLAHVVIDVDGSATDEDAALAVIAALEEIL